MYFTIYQTTHIMPDKVDTLYMHTHDDLTQNFSKLVSPLNQLNGLIPKQRAPTIYDIVRCRTVIPSWKDYMIDNIYLSFER